MQVLHINSNYLTSRLHENLIERLEGHNIHNTIYMPIKPGTEKEFLHQSKFDIHHPTVFKNKDKFFFVWKQAKIYNKLKKIINPKEYTLTHAHTLFTDGNIAYRLYKEYGIPYIVTVRGYTDIQSFFKFRVNLRHRGRQILKNASRIVFLSETNKKELLSSYIHSKELKDNILSKSLVIPNGIDDYWFENEGKPKQLNNKKELQCIYVGKMMKLKNVLGTVDALNTLEKNHGIKAKLITIGKEVDSSYVEKVRSKADGKVEIYGQMPREELIHFYRQSDLFIMPSFKETFGLVYPEAMSQGLPIIYSKGQGFDQQFEDGTVGFPVNPNNSQDIAEKILSILDHYEEISKRALEKYKEFNWDNIAKVYNNEYKKFE